MITGNAVPGEASVSVLRPAADRQGAQRRQLQAQAIRQNERTLADGQPHRGRRRDQQVPGNQLRSGLAHDQRRGYLHVSLFSRKNPPSIVIQISRPRIPTMHQEIPGV